MYYRIRHYANDLDKPILLNPMQSNPVPIFYVLPIQYQPFSNATL